MTLTALDSASLPSIRLLPGGSRVALVGGGMIKTLGRVLVAILLVAAAAAVLLVSPIARPAVALLPSFAVALPALILTAC